MNDGTYYVEVRAGGGPWVPAGSAFRGAKNLHSSEADARDVETACKLHPKVESGWWEVRVRCERPETRPVPVGVAPLVDHMHAAPAPEPLPPADSGSILDAIRAARGR